MFAERLKTKNVAVIEETEKKDEEDWALKDVVFVEDVKNVPVGRVLKVDGAYAAVRFLSKDNPPTSSTPTASSSSTSNEDAFSLLQDCRLLRKDELQIVKSGSATRVPECFQKIPKRINVSEIGVILAISVDGQGNITVFLIYSSLINF